MLDPSQAARHELESGTKGRHRLGSHKRFPSFLPPLSYQQLLSLEHYSLLYIGMPKATEAKGRPAASPLTSRARRRRDSPSPSDSTDRDPKPSLELDKSLVLEILVAKLDGSKAFDWFTLAQKLGSQDTSTADGVATRVSPAGPGSKAKKRVSGAQCNPKDSKTPSFGGWTGAQLHDLYHNVSPEASPGGNGLYHIRRPLMRNRSSFLL